MPGQLAELDVVVLLGLVVLILEEMQYFVKDIGGIVFDGLKVGYRQIKSLHVVAITRGPI